MQILTYDNSKHREQTLRLWERVFGPAKEYNDPALSIDLKQAVDDLLFVAMQDDRVVGTVMAGYDGHRGWIYSLAVQPEDRTAGIGSALLNHAEHALSARGCLKVNLQIVANNSAVQQFYEANGYTEEARISMGKRLG
jgi:ribosomal protein S18 acetylase RimI-like enzyme